MEEEFGPLATPIRKFANTVPKPLPRTRPTGENGVGRKTSEQRPSHRGASSKKRNQKCGGVRQKAFYPSIVRRKKEEMEMELTMNQCLLRAGGWMKPGLKLGLSLLLSGLGILVQGQTVSTTTVQGTVYLANGLTGPGTLSLSWPAFTTASGLAVAADSLTTAIAGGRICQCEPRTQSGIDTSRSLLHGDLPDERWVDKHGVLGCSGGGADDDWSGARATDARSAGSAGGEQDVC